MSNETHVTVTGNLTADPDLRFTPSGVPVANLTIASTPRYYDKQANEFKDAETLFMRCTAWREMAENVSESLTKGTRVIAQGKLQAKSYEDKEGNKRTAWELAVDEIGPSLRYATAKPVKVPPKGQQSQPQGGGFGGHTSQSAADPWGGQPTGGGWGAPQGEEPPF